MAPRTPETPMAGWVRRRPKPSSQEGEVPEGSGPGQVAPEQGPELLFGDPARYGMEKVAGFPSAGLENWRKERTQRRRQQRGRRGRQSRRLKKENRNRISHCVFSLAILSLGLGWGLPVGAEGRSAKHLVAQLNHTAKPWTNLNQEHTYWALVRHFPQPRPVTWNGDPVPLVVVSNASLLMGGGVERPVISHEQNKTIIMRSPTLPICLSKGAHAGCAQVENDTITELPHGPHGWIGKGDHIHFYVLQHQRSTLYQRHQNYSLWLNHTNSGFSNISSHSYTQNVTSGFFLSPLPLCTPSPNMFVGFQICSTGHQVDGENVNGTQLYFLDGQPGPWFAAPVPHVRSPRGPIAHAHLWKLAAAFAPLIHFTDNSAPLSDNSTLRNWWWDLLFSAGRTCNSHGQLGHCNDFNVTIQTTSDRDMFWICRNGTITPSSAEYAVHCSNGSFSNTLQSTDVASNATMVLLLRVPPITFVPVLTTQPFAQSPIERFLLRRYRREVGGLDLINLALNIAEALDLVLVNHQLSLLARHLEEFMEETTQAWTVQQPFNRLLLNKVEFMATVLADTVLEVTIAEKLSTVGCSYEFQPPMCVTALHPNSSIDSLIKNLTDFEQIEDCLGQLDIILEHIRNVTRQTRDNLFPDSPFDQFFNWLHNLGSSQFLLWLIYGAGFLILICFMAPCLFFCWLRVLRRSLENVKADLSLPKKNPVFV